MTTKKSTVLRPGEVENSFRKIAAGSKIKFKEYFLRRIGLASHEVRINLQANIPFSQGRSDRDSYRARSFYSRPINLCSFQLINSSGTSPSITRVAVLARIPDGTQLRFKSGSAVASDDGLVAGWEKHFLSAPEQKDPVILDVPRLSPGSYLSFPSGSFSCYVEWPDVIEQFDDEGGYMEESSEVTPEMAQEMERLIDELLQSVETWLSVELDSNELLPFRWVPAQEAFVPAFKTDGTVVRG